MTYFDTSPAYGPDGEAETPRPRPEGTLSSWLSVSLLRISTKTGTHPQLRHRYDADSTRWTVDRILTTLLSERIDVLFIHDPRDDADVDAAFASGGALEALEALKGEG